MPLEKPEELTLAEKLSRLDKIADKTNKKYGKKVMGRIGKEPEIAEAMTLRYVPTPCRDLNMAIAGNAEGGFPIGRCTIVAGSEDSGKTSICLETAADMMKRDPNWTCGWLESENSLTKEYACNTFGIDPERFFFVPLDPDVGAEKTMDMIQGVLGTGALDMFVLNSLSCLVPTQELEAELESSTVAVQARFNARLSKKFLALVGKSNAAFVLICHLTTQIGSMSRDPLIISGGKAIKYWSSLTLDMRKHSIGPGDPITKEDGVKICVTIKKNHCRQDIFGYKKLEYYAIFGEGIEQILTVIPTAVEIGVLEKHGPWLYWNNPNGELIEKFASKAAFREAMKNDPVKWQKFLDQLDGKESTIEDVSEEEAEAIKADEKAIESKILLDEDEPKTKKAKKDKVA